MVRLYDETGFDYNEPQVTYNGALFSVATGSGVGTETADGVHAHVRTASGSGQGTESATELMVAIRTASGSGQSSQSATELMVAIRTASGSGTGTETADGIHVQIRTATGSGQGTESATQNKLFIFRPPVNDSFSWADRNNPVPGDFLLRKLVPGARAKNIYLLNDGTYTTNQPAEIEDYAKVYLGAHNNFVSADEKADLISAGYGSYVT